MRRSEALIGMLIGLAMLTAGAVWAWGPWPLIGLGIVVIGFVLYVVDIHGGGE